MFTGSGLRLGRNEVSGIIGLVGGLVDLVVGFMILQQTSSRMNMQVSDDGIFGWFLVAFGVMVVMSGGYALVSRMMRCREMGVLMVVYGLVMLVIGIGMIEQLFNLMMRGSIISGLVMILIGITMLYCGVDMTLRRAAS